MKSLSSKQILAGIAAMLAFGAAAQATPTISSLINTGTLRVTTYNPTTQVSNTTLVNPYGNPPQPTITPITSGWVLTFAPSSDFFASGNNFSGSNPKTTEVDGHLEFDITFTSPVVLTTNIYEDGIWSTTGAGSKLVNGGVTVKETNDIILPESHQGGYPAAAFTPSGGWTLFTQVGGFSGSYTSYHVVVDNTIIAESMTLGTAFIAKKDFSIVLTTDGTNGGGQAPEPASLGVMAVGCLALIVRRRRI